MDAGGTEPALNAKPVITTDNAGGSAALVRPRSAFEHYQALVAAQRSFDLLPDSGRGDVLAAVHEVLAGPLGQSSSDRRTPARSILEKAGT